MTFQLKIILREGGLFVRVDGENDEAKEVRIPGEEGPAILRAVVSGQVPEGIASSDRVRYIEVKRAVEVYELGSVPLGESGYNPMAMFFTGGYFTVEGDRFRVLSMEGLGGIYAPIKSNFLPIGSDFSKLGDAVLFSYLKSLFYPTPEQGARGGRRRWP